MSHWDPIGVKDEPMAKSEYSSYVGSIYRLLSSGAADSEISSTLERIETEEMGLRASPRSRRAAVIRALRVIDIRLA